MATEDDVQLGDVIEEVSTAEYKRLAKAGFTFNTLTNDMIAKYPSLDGIDFASRRGQESKRLVESICDKTSDLKTGYPHVKKNANYRWNVRFRETRVSSVCTQIKRKEN